jgi:hypothetical protein
MTYLAFVLDDRSRALLLERLPPRFSNVIAHHVTLIYPKTEGEKAKMRRMYIQLLDQECDVEVYREYVGEHIHAAGVIFNGATTKMLGGFYHVTMSLENPAKPVDSNKLKEFTTLDKPFKLTGTLQLC